MSAGEATHVISKPPPLVLIGEAAAACAVAAAANWSAAAMTEGNKRVERKRAGVVDRASLNRAGLSQ